MTTLDINTEFITLGQLLKMIDVISSGGMAKWFLDEHIVNVNNEEEQRRGKKLRHGDIIEIEGTGTFKINAVTDGTTDAH